MFTFHFSSLDFLPHELDIKPPSPENVVLMIDALTRASGSLKAFIEIF